MPHSQVLLDQPPPQTSVRPWRRLQSQVYRRAQRGPSRRLGRLTRAPWWILVTSTRWYRSQLQVSGRRPRTWELRSVQMEAHCFRPILRRRCLAHAASSLLPSEARLRISVLWIHSMLASIASPSFRHRSRSQRSLHRDSSLKHVTSLLLRWTRWNSSHLIGFTIQPTKALFHWSKPSVTNMTLKLIGSRLETRWSRKRMSAKSSRLLREAPRACLRRRLKWPIQTHTEEPINELLVTKLLREKWCRELWVRLRSCSLMVWVSHQKVLRLELDNQRSSWQDRKARKLSVGREIDTLCRGPLSTRTTSLWWKAQMGSKSLIQNNWRRMSMTGRRGSRLWSSLSQIKVPNR